MGVANSNDKLGVKKERVIANDISPALAAAVESSMPRSILNEMGTLGSVCAYEKVSDSRVSGYFCSSIFYPGYRLHKIRPKLRRHEKVPPYTSSLDLGPDNVGAFLGAK